MCVYVCICVWCSFKHRPDGPQQLSCGYGCTPNWDQMWNALLYPRPRRPPLYPEMIPSYCGLAAASISWCSAGCVHRGHQVLSSLVHLWDSKFQTQQFKDAAVTVNSPTELSDPCVSHWSTECHPKLRTTLLSKWTLIRHSPVENTVSVPEHMPASTANA